MGGQGTALQAKDVEAVIQNARRKHIDTDSRQLLQEPLERFDEMDQEHAVELSQMTIQCRFRQTELFEIIVDVSEQAPLPSDGILIMSERDRCLPGHGPRMAQSILDLAMQVDEGTRHDPLTLHWPVRSRVRWLWFPHLQPATIRRRFLPSRE